MRNQKIILGVLLVLLASCGAQEAKKKTAVDTVDESLLDVSAGNVPSGVAAMGASTGRYEGAGAKPCTVSTTNWMKTMYKVVDLVKTVGDTVQAYGQPDSGHYYLYEARQVSSSGSVTKYTIPYYSVKYDAAGKPLTDSSGSYVKSTKNIGLQIQSAQVSTGVLKYYIFATYALEGWKRFGELTSESDGEKLKLIGGSAVVTAAPTTLTPPDAEAGVKNSALSILNKILLSSSATSPSMYFHMEIFSDPNANQILLITSEPDSSGIKYELEFGREAQPLKPLVCSNGRYTSCSYNSACKSGYMMSK